MDFNVPFEYRPSVRLNDGRISERLKKLEKTAKEGVFSQELLNELDDLRDEFARTTRFVVSESLMVRFLKIEKVINENLTRL